MIGLDYSNPYLHPFKTFQQYKTHPSVAPIFEVSFEFTLTQNGYVLRATFLYPTTTHTVHTTHIHIHTQIFENQASWCPNKHHDILKPKFWKSYGILLLSINKALRSYIYIIHIFVSINVC